MFDRAVSTAAGLGQREQRFRSNKWIRIEHAGLHVMAGSRWLLRAVSAPLIAPLDRAMRLLSDPLRAGDALLGQRSVVDDDLFTIFQTTCDIYLGRGQRVIPVLEPRLTALAASSVRTATITRAKLARAYASAGQPHEAAQLSLAALDDIERVGSLSARSELRRALPTLRQWHGREDIQAVLQRISSTA